MGGKQTKLICHRCSRKVKGKTHEPTISFFFGKHVKTVVFKKKQHGMWYRYLTAFIYRGKTLRVSGRTLCSSCFYAENNEDNRKRVQIDEQRRKEEVRKRKREEARKRKREEARRKTEASMKHLNKELNSFLESDRENRFREQAAAKEKTVNVSRYRQHLDIGADLNSLDNHEGEDTMTYDPKCFDILQSMNETKLTKDILVLLLEQIDFEKEKSKLKINEVAFINVNEILLLFHELYKDWKTSELLPRWKILEWMHVYFFELYCQFAIDESSTYQLISSNLMEIFNEVTKSVMSKADLFILTQTMLYLLLEFDLETESPLYGAIKQNWNPDILPHTRYSLQFLSSLISKERGLVGVGEPVPIAPSWSKAAIQTLAKMCFHNGIASFDHGGCLCSLARNEIWRPDEVLDGLKIMVKFPASLDLAMARILEIILAFRLSASKPLLNDDTILDLMTASDLDNILPVLVKEIENEEEKSLDCILEEMRALTWATEGDIQRVCNIVKGAQGFLGNIGFPGELHEQDGKTVLNKESVNSGSDISNITDTQLSQSLVSLCCGIKKVKNYWPRNTQMVSWTMLILAKKVNGRLVEISTGEGKSCIIAMVAAMLAIHGNAVDIVTSSPMLAARDSPEWEEFYSLFDLRTNHNIDKMTDQSKSNCYMADIVYGTVGSFAGDILRHEFERKCIRGSRSFDAVIVDEVDFMLLDRGVQFTYLSHRSIGLKHLEPVLAMVWQFVSSQNVCISTAGELFVMDTPKPFHMAISDLLDQDIEGYESPQQLLLLAQENSLITKEFVCSFQKASPSECLDLLATISTETLITILEVMNDYIPYQLMPYTIRSDGQIEPVSGINYHASDVDEVVPVLITGNGFCALLNDDETLLQNIIIDTVRSYISPERTEETIDLPNSIIQVARDRIPTWVANAFIAANMNEGREYLIKGGQVLPIDFHSTGIVEVNKKWGDGLQQMVELKHRLAMSPLTFVTNFMSNIAFFKTYEGNVFGVTGTLGSSVDRNFLKNKFDVDFCHIPTHMPRKLFEEEGEILTNETDWLRRICEKVEFEVGMKQWGTKGRAALVICEDINSVNKIAEHLKEMKRITSVTIYARSDNEEKSATEKRFTAGDVIVATNLAGRGTDFKLTNEVNMSGGLFVLVTFLPMNTRIEKQAFGRSGRKGQSGSCQIILNSSSLQHSIRSSTSVIQLKKLRDTMEEERMTLLEETEVSECMLKENLFSMYLRHLSDTYKRVESITDEDERKIIIESVNEHWGLWLQKHSEKIANLEEDQLIKDLDSSIKHAQDEAIRKESPSANIYSIIKFGNELMFQEKYDSACTLYQKAINLDDRWAAIAYYNMAYCTMRRAKENFMEETISQLKSSMKSLSFYAAEVILTNTLVQKARSLGSCHRGLASSVETRMQIFNCISKHMEKTLNKLQDIKSRKRKAEICDITGIFSLVSDPDPGTQQEVYDLWQMGLLYVFSVKEKPRFCWEGLIVFFLGIIQVAVGACLTAFSFVTIGKGLISEGISDVFNGIKAMASGNLSWKSWGIAKAISIGTSILAAGLVKVASAAYKMCKLGVTKAVNFISKLSPDSVKNIGNHVSKAIGNVANKTTETAKYAYKKVLDRTTKLVKGSNFDKSLVRMKQLPQMISDSFGEGMNPILKANFKNVGKLVAKNMAEEAISCGLDFVQDTVMNELKQQLQEKIETLIRKKVSNSVDTGCLSSVIERILSYETSDIDTAKSGVITLFKTIGADVADEFIDNIETSGYVIQIFQTTIDKIHSNLKKMGVKEYYTKVINGIITAASMADGIAKVKEMVTNFEELLFKKANDFCEEKNIPRINGESINTQALQAVKNEIKDILIKLLSTTVTDILHERVTSQLARQFRKKINKMVGEMTEDVLHTSKTAEKLKAGISSRHIQKAKIKDVEALKYPSLDNPANLHVQEYIHSNVDQDVPGSILDIRVLCQTMNINVQILEPSKHGLRQVAGITSPTSNKTVKLVYRKAKSQNSVGHYDVLLDGKLMSVMNEGNSCLYHAVATGLNPEASRDELTTHVGVLKGYAKEELSLHPWRWRKIIQMSQHAVQLTKGPDFMLVGGLRVSNRKRRVSLPTSVANDVLDRSGVGKVGTYRDLQNVKRQNKMRGRNPSIDTNFDHQPPFSCIQKALAGTEMGSSRLGQILGKGILPKEVDGKGTRGKNLITVTVPEGHHKFYLTTGNSKVAQATRGHISKAIAEDNPVDMFKRTFIASSPTFVCEAQTMMGNADKLPQTIADKEQREPYEGRGFRMVVERWYEDYLGTGDNPVMTAKEKVELLRWIDSGKYKDQTDLAYQEMLQIVSSRITFGQLVHE